MYIPISRINAASLTRSPHQSDSASGGSSPLSFPEMMAAVAAAMEDQVRRIKKKYGLAVRIMAVAKDCGKRESTGAGDRRDRQELVIAPNILQQMSKDPVMQRKVYGYLDEYVREPYSSPGHSLIVHRDGTSTLLPVVSRPAAGQEITHLHTGQPEIAGSLYDQDRLKQLAFLRARRAGRQR
ncbi:hypothetical protein MHH28_21115 [Paenibacillus sp. FSL K6-1217]|uniref:hypothetical protein n=1 Tax=Paenibacillus sp. FSL K6-1217 TaxID=2921466 RepID=UPI00324F593F